MPVQKTIVAEKIMCVGFMGENFLIITFGHELFPEEVFVQTAVLMLTV